jgi:hypothetical protein
VGDGVMGVVCMGGGCCACVVVGEGRWGGRS